MIDETDEGDTTVITLTCDVEKCDGTARLTGPLEVSGVAALGWMVYRNDKLLCATHAKAMGAAIETANAAGIEARDQALAGAGLTMRKSEDNGDGGGAIAAEAVAAVGPGPTDMPRT